MCAYSACTPHVLRAYSACAHSTAYPCGSRRRARLLPLHGIGLGSTSRKTPATEHQDKVRLSLAGLRAAARARAAAKEVRA
jgi:hypothetical protein